MRPFRRSGKWLDIGFGRGDLLDSAREGGWICFGTEFSAVARDQAEGRGVSVAVDTLGFPDATFDVVSLVELIEHVETPVEVLGEAHRVLRPGGCLYITTPNAWSLNRWLLRDDWSVFCPPDHLTIFTPRGLVGMIRSRGFTEVELRAEGLNPFEILRKLRGEKTSPEGPQFNRVEAGTRLCAGLSSSPARLRFKSLANSILSLARIGDGLKLRAVK